LSPRFFIPGIGSFDNEILEAESAWKDQAHDAPVGPERELSHRGVDPADGHAFSNVEGWPGSPVYPFTWPPIGPPSNAAD